jgi:hypothetical protein
MRAASKDAASLELPGARAVALSEEAHALAAAGDVDGAAAALGQAVSTAASLRFFTVRIGALCDIARILGEDQNAALAALARKSVLEAILAIEDDHWREEGVRAVVPLLGEARLETALAIRERRARANTLIAVAADLAGDRKQQALDAALRDCLAIRSKPARANLLLALIPQLDGLQKRKALDAALRTSLAVGDEGVRVDLFMRLLPQLDGEQLEMALGPLLGGSDAWSLPGLVEALGAALRGASGQQALDRVLWQALGERNAADQAEFVLSAACHHVSSRPEQRGIEAAFRLALAMSDEAGRTRALVALAPALAGEQLDAAVEAIQAVQDQAYRAWGLASVAPYLGGDRQAEATDIALHAAADIVDGELRDRVLSTLAIQLASREQDDAVEPAIRMALAIQHDAARTDALERMGARLSPRQYGLAAGLLAVRANEVSRLSALAALRLGHEEVGLEGLQLFAGPFGDRFPDLFDEPAIRPKSIGGSAGAIIGYLAYGDVISGLFDTGGRASIKGDVEAGGDFVGRDKVVDGDEVQGDKVGADKVARDKFEIHVGSGASPQDVRAAADLANRLAHPPELKSEPIRLDVAAPRTATVGQYFLLAIAVKQPASPPLSIADLPDVTSGEGEIFRSPDQPIVQYRVEISAPNFEIPQPSYVFRLEAARDSRPRYFQMKPLCAGTLPVLVNAYQIVEEEDLVAQTTLTVRALLAVVDGEGGSIW